MFGIGGAIVWEKIGRYSTACSHHRECLHHQGCLGTGCNLVMSKLRKMKGIANEEEEEIHNLRTRHRKQDCDRNARPHAGFSLAL